MASLKVDSEHYPSCLWYSVTGSLIGAFQFGYAVAVLNTALPYIAKDLHYHKDAFLSSAVVVGAAFGAILAGKAADRLGPRHAQVVNCLAFILGALLTGGATSHQLFFVGRFLSGFGAGAASLYVPRYIAEVSPPGLRGWLGSLNQVLINAGIMVAYCSGVPYELGFSGFDVFGGNVFVAWWRTMNALAVLPAVMQVLVLSGCPESPVWLEGRGLRDAADDACIRLWGARALLPDPTYEADAAAAADLVSSASMGLGVSAHPGFAGQQQSLTMPLLQQSYHSDSLTAAAAAGFVHRNTVAQGSAEYSRGNSAGSSYNSYNRQRLQEPSRALDRGMESLHRGSVGLSASRSDWQGHGTSMGCYEGWQGLFAHRYRLMMVLAVGLPLLQQLSGINTVVYYSSKLFASAGLQSPIAASICTGGVNLGVTLLAAALLDRCGRKPLLLVSHVGMAAALGAVAAVAAVTGSSVRHGMLLVVLVLLYVACFAAGSGPVTWVVLSEVLPTAIKGPAASLATAAAWTGNLLVTLSFDSLLHHLGLSGTYLMYALCNLAAALLVAQLLVETRCRSLQEIEALLLLPDMDPRLAALWPALQQHQQQQAESTAGGSPPAGATVVIRGTEPRYRPAPAAAAASIDRNSSSVHQQQQQQLVLQQAAGGGAFDAGPPRLAAAAAHPPSIFYGSGAPATGAAVAAMNNTTSFGWPGAGRLRVQTVGAAATAAAHVGAHHDDFDLPSALAAEMESSQEEVYISKQHYVAGWAVNAAEVAAADAAAAVASLHHADIALQDEAASEQVAVSDSYASEPQQQSPELQPHEKRAALMQRYGGKEVSSIPVAAADVAPVVVKGFVIQNGTRAVGN